MFEEDVKSDYDPLISGLEPESFETVFKELFTGIKQYLGDEEDKDDEPEEWNLFPDENHNDLILCWEPELPMPDCTRPHTPPFTMESKPTIPLDLPAELKKSRQYSVLRCRCHEDFPSQFALEFHETRYHPHLFNWFCSECNLNFKTLQEAGDHLILIHSTLKMPLFGDMYDPVKKPSGPLLMQSITRRSTDFTREFLESRGTDTIMTTAYYLFAKCELQAVVAGSVGLSMYNQAKTNLIATTTAAQYEDFLSCLKSTFIYGKYIKRVPLPEYYGPTTVFKTLTFTTAPAKKAPYQQGRIVSATSNAPRYQQFGQGPLYRVAPYPQTYPATQPIRTPYKPPPASRSRHYVLANPSPAKQNYVRRTTIRDPIPPRHTPYQFQRYSPQ